MSSAESEAWTKAMREDGSVDHDLYEQEFKKLLAERQERMVREAHDTWRSIEGWRGVETQEDWDRIVGEAVVEHERGVFFLDRLGGQKYLDPKMMAVLRIIRADLIREYGADSASDVMLVDMALMHYHHAITTNEWIGNIIASAQTELFGSSSLAAKVEKRHGREVELHGLRIEEFIRRLTEQLMPLIERSNVLLLRNLKALEERKRAKEQRALPGRPTDVPRPIRKSS